MEPCQKYDFRLSEIQLNSVFPCSLTLPPPECLLIAASLPPRRPWLPCVRERPSGQAPSTGKECAFGHGLGGFDAQKDADLLSRGCRVAGRTSGYWGGREREKESTKEAVATHSYQRTDGRERQPPPPTPAATLKEIIALSFHFLLLQSLRFLWIASFHYPGSFPLFASPLRSLLFCPLPRLSLLSSLSSVCFQLDVRKRKYTTEFG